MSVYLFEGIAKRPFRNKQSTPTPYRYISNPLSGSGYTTRESNFTAYPSEQNFGEFSNKDKAETLSQICLLWGGQLFATHKIDAKILNNKEKSKEEREKFQ